MTSDQLNGKSPSHFCYKTCSRIAHNATKPDLQIKRHSFDGVVFNDKENKDKSTEEIVISLFTKKTDNSNGYFKIFHEAAQNTK